MSIDLTTNGWTTITSAGRTIAWHYVSAINEAKRWQALAELLDRHPDLSLKTAVAMIDATDDQSSIAGARP
jgi:hypothetical protein